jgi:hypothetical protein
MEIQKIWVSSSIYVDDRKQPPGTVLIYHVHGRSQFYGTCKIHKRPDCPILQGWKPGFIGGKLRIRLKKIIMEDTRRSYEEVPERLRCKICWTR